MKGQNNNFGYKSLINNYCWGIINDTLNRYEIDQNILGTHIYMLFDTENPYRRTANKCNIAKTTLSKNPFLVVNKKTITLDEIDRVPFWLSMHKGRYINSSIAMGVIQKHKNKFKIWDKKTAIKDLTPIVTAKEALIYLYLMEGVFPISDFSFLCDPTKIGLFNEETEDNYTISDKNIKPTQVFEIDTFFIINVFYYNYDNNCIFEISYKLLKNGNYEIINKRLIYKNPEDIIDNVLD